MKWGDKRYRSLNFFLREKFGGKVMKISLDGGFSCPNRDGRISREGCIFCSERGSGDFAGNRCNPISRQFDDVVKVMEKKWQADQYIAYFQAFTNTYDTVDNLRQKYDEAIRHQGVVALAIATRPDCIDEPVARLLAEYSRRVYTWVELGLQTSNEATGRLINRGYDNLAYEKAMALLTSYDIPVVTHIIFGLPGETHEDMLRSVKYVNVFKPAGIKLHLLHLMKHTPMVQLYEAGRLRFLEFDEYVELVVQALTLIYPDTVIHRLTGDAPRSSLIGPEWSLKKWEILNAIDRKLEAEDLWQGKFAAE